MEWRVQLSRLLWWLSLPSSFSCYWNLLINCSLVHIWLLGIIWLHKNVACHHCNVVPCLENNKIKALTIANIFTGYLATQTSPVNLLLWRMSPYWLCIRNIFPYRAMARKPNSGLTITCFLPLSRHKSANRNVCKVVKNSGNFQGFI